MKPTSEELNSFAQHLNSMPPMRPHLSPHNSHSVPSTPFFHARKNSFGARSPSPTRIIRNGSPKSVHSNLENGYRSKAPSFTGCKYETGMAFSRRRIPYSIGGDQLERAKAPPKKFLSPDQEMKLSTDMRELYDRILPSKESDEKRTKFVQKLEKILNDQWPGNEIKVHVFGSSGNMLCTSDSDVDICITTTMKALERVCMLAKALADHGMEKVICVPHAKVPIVKFWDPELGLACDMNVNNTLALENTRMIRTYVEIDERVRPLAMIIKHWTKKRILNDAALGGTLSSYTWICMILNFLQTRNPPILPSLHRKSHGRKHSTDVKVAGFNDNVDKLRDFGASNRESIGELLFNFFRRYAHDLDYEKDVVSVREGRLISKEAKTWHLMQNNRLCVEEPFNTERNLGNTADDISFRGIHLELRRAFDLISEAKLEECLEQYEFPATEEKIWEKPTPKPTPVIRSRSQSNSSRRGGYQNRGGGKHNHHKNTGRRASSAAATNKYPLPPIDHLPQMPPGLRGRNFSPRDPHDLFQPQQAAAVHDILMLSMQALHEEEQKLRLKQQQNAEAAVKLQSEPMERRASQPFSARNSQSNVAPPSRQVPMSAPLRGGQFFQPWIYPQVSGTPIQQSIHTQPSSPSMKAAQPDLRRSLHRSNGQDHNNSSNMRSHSQPARPVPMGVSSSQQNAPPMPLNSQSYLHYQQQLQQYQHQRQLYGAMDGGAFGAHYLTPDALMYQASRRMPIDRNTMLMEDNVPKEYVGYWMNDSPPQNADEAAAMMAHFQNYHQDMLPRVRGVPASISSLRRNSRSPSPSPALPFRDRSYSVRSASSAPISQQRFDPRPSHLYGSSRTGPIIMNGTNGWNTDELPPMVDNVSHTTTISEATSSSDDHQYETSGGDPSFPHVMPENNYTMEEIQQYFHPQAMPPDLARISAMNYNGSHDTVRRRGPPVQNNETPSPPSTIKRVNRSNGNALGIQFGEVEFQRPAVNGHPQPQEPAPSSSVKVEQKPISTTPNGQFDQNAAPVPLLSPVREVRTPSPLGKRLEKAKATIPQNVPPFPKNLEFRIPSYAELARAREAKQNGAPTQRANGAAPTSKLADAPMINHKSPPAKHISPQYNTIKPAAAPSDPSTNVSPGQVSSQNMPPKSPERQYGQPQASTWQQQSSKKNKKNRSRPGSGQFPGEPLPVNEAERKGG